MSVNWTDVSIAPLSALQAVRNLPNKHGLYIKPFPKSNGVRQNVTSFTEDDNFADAIPVALPFNKTVESEERTMLSGLKLRGKRTVSADNQTVRIEVFAGEDKFALLADREIAVVEEDVTDLTGEDLAFARTYPDGTAIVGNLLVENMNGEADPAAAQFGQDVELSFPKFYRTNVIAGAAPTGTRAPASGTTGTVVTITGTRLDTVTALKYGVATIPASAFATQSATSITFAIPAGQTTGSKAMAMVYPGGEVALGNFTQS